MIGDAGPAARPRRRPCATGRRGRRSGRGPASLGWISSEGRLRRAPPSARRALGQSAIVDQQGVGEEREPSGAGASGAVPPGSSVVSRGASSRPISSWSWSSVSNPRSPPAAAARLAKISQSGRLMPAGGAERPDPLAAAFPVGDVPVVLQERRGREERVGERLEVPSSSDWTTTVSTFWSARRASAASGASRSGSTPIRNSTSSSRSAAARRMSTASRPASATMAGPQTRSSSARSAGRGEGGHRARAPGAHPPPARRGRPLAGSRTRTARPSSRPPRGPRPPHRAVRRRSRRRARPRRGAPPAPRRASRRAPGEQPRLVTGPARHVVGDIGQARLARGGRRRSERPDRRPCATGGAGSGSPARRRGRRP